MAGGLYDMTCQSFNGATMPEFVKVKSVIVKNEKTVKDEAKLGGESYNTVPQASFFLVRICRWSAKFVFDLIPHRANIFLGLAHLGRDHPP